jgi:hypothetical protein
MPGLYQTPFKKTISRPEFPFPASGLISAAKSNADFVPETTPLPRDVEPADQ